MSLFEILRFYDRYHRRRVTENLSQRELLKQELTLIGAALATIVVGGALVVWLIIRFVPR